MYIDDIMALHNYTVESDKWDGEDCAVIYAKDGCKVCIMIIDFVYYISATTELLKEYFKKCIMEEIVSG